MICRHRPAAGVQLQSMYPDLHPASITLGSVVDIIRLCVLSMSENQMGFKSPVYRMNIEEQRFARMGAGKTPEAQAA